MKTFRAIVQIEFDEDAMCKGEAHESDHALEDDLIVAIRNSFPVVHHHGDVLEVQLVYPCGVCDFAGTCPRILGEECHT